MTSRFFERRSIRNQLKTYLEARGWVNLTWSEGFSSYTIPEVVPPFIAITLTDLGKEELEMGSDPTINKTYTRRLQVNVYMESEERVEAISDDIGDFLDLEPIIIKDNANNVLGSMISDTSSILANTDVPSLSDEKNLEWNGVVVCMYDVHYPNG